MRKIYFLLAVLLLQFASVSSSAQDVLLSLPGDDLIQDVSQLTSNASDVEEGAHIEYLIDNDASTFWHSDWRGKVTDPHYLQVTVSEPVSDGYIIVYMRRRADQSVNIITQGKLIASADGTNWDELGNWTNLPNATSGAEMATEPVAITKAYTMFRFVNTQTSPIFFHAAEFQLKHANEAQIVQYVLDQTYDKYKDYYDDNDFSALNTGTEVGQYTDTKTAELIKTALTNLNNWVAEQGEDIPATVAAAQEFSKELDKLFATYKESEVLYSLPANGYYRIISNLPYKNGTNEKGEPIYVKKAMFCSTDYKGMWGTVKEDMANYIWKLTTTENGIDMYNAGMEARFTKLGTECKLAEDGDKVMSFDFAGNEDGHTVIYIRENTAERGTSVYLHQNGHERGLRVEDQPLVLWVGTFEMEARYSTDRGTSEWYLEPVDEAEAEAIIQAFGPIKNHDQLVEQNNALRAEVLAAITTAKDYQQVNLITSSEQMTSPWSQNREGNTSDGGDLIDGVLIDGNPSSYWHSIWQNKPDDLTGDPYLQLSGMKEMQGDVYLYIKYRITGEGFPVQFTMKGSDAPEADDDAWTTMATINLGNQGSGNEYTTGAIKIETPYSNIRLYNTNTTYSYFHLAELQLFKLSENPNSQFAALGDIATNLETIYNQNVAIDDADITIDIYNALLAAYEAFKSGMCDPEPLRTALANYAVATKGYVEGTNPGQWASSEARDAFETLYKEAKAYNEAGKYTQAKINYYAAALPVAASNVMASANAPKVDTWYRIKFPSKQLYQDNNWNTSNIGEGTSDVQVPIYDNVVVAGEYEQAAGQAYFNYWPTDAENIREGSHLIGVTNEDLDLVDNPGIGMFRFVPVEAPIAPVNEFNNLIEQSSMLLGMTTTRIVGEPMITSEKQLSSNASDKEEGKDMYYLIDGKPNTFWHSNWHSDVIINEPHFLQVSFDQPVSGLIEVDITRRTGAGGANGHVLRMYVTGSNDGENWDRLGYIDMPYDHEGERVLSTPVDLNGSYTKLRFIATKRNSTADTQYDIEVDPFGNEGTYFHAAEFQIRPVTVSGASEKAAALQTAWANANKVLSNEITNDDYTALATAYNDLQQEVNAQGAHIVPVASKKPMKYVLQNRATGLFVNTLAPNDHEVTLQLTPTIISHAAIGYGENTLRSDDLSGLFCTYLHLQRNTHQLVTWNENNPGSNSGLMLEEVEPSEEEDFTFVKDFALGKLYAWCYPVSFKPANDVTVYTVAGKYTQDKVTYVALDQADEVVAGKPVIAINGKLTDWEAPSEGSDELTDGYECKLAAGFNFTVASANGLIGSYTAATAPTGTYTCADNGLAKVEEENGAAISGGSAYLNVAECPEVSAEGHALSIALNSPTGIQGTLEQVSKRGNIYTVDGKLVRANGSLNDINKMGKGLYILNGVKVLVK